MTFQQANEMERMVQMGTGALDVASAIKNQSQSGANSMSSNSMLMGAFVKRSKRSIANISRNFIGPLLEKVIWRYMQFDPIRYPQDFDLKLKPTLGIVAREVEAGQMTQLMGMMPQEYHQVQLLLAKGIVEHTALSNKGELLQAIQQALTPPPPEEQKKQKQLADMAQQAQVAGLHAQVEGYQLQNQKTQAEIKKILADAGKKGHEAQMQESKTQQEWARIHQSQQEAEQFAAQNHIAAARLPIEWLMAQARMVSAKAQEHAAKHPPAKAK
jgi:DNA primase